MQTCAYYCAESSNMHVHTVTTAAMAVATCMRWAGSAKWYNNSCLCQATATKMVVVKVVVATVTLLATILISAKPGLLCR